MPTDRYTKLMLTIIAGALLYLCIVLTPLPAVQAQAPPLRPGQISSEPLPVVITGWQAAGQAMPVTFQRPVPVTVNNDVRVITERASGVADRVGGGTECVAREAVAAAELQQSSRTDRQHRDSGHHAGITTAALTQSTGTRYAISSRGGDCYVCSHFGADVWFAGSSVAESCLNADRDHG